MAESDLPEVEAAIEEVTTSETGDVTQKESKKDFEIVDWFKNKIKESRVTFVVYYRGYW